MMKEPVLFGVRHLSPAGGWHLRRLLEDVKPRLVLVEGPSDLTPQMADLTHPQTRPPVALLAFTMDAPVRSILYPFAAYSPEYQAIQWAAEHGAACRFMDLPSDVFLALADADRPDEGEEGRGEVYRALDAQTGEDGHETFWERTLEHTTAPGAYYAGAGAFGAQLRGLTAGQDGDWAETLVREAYMRRQIDEAITEGFLPEEIVVVTGAYHVEGLRTASPMTDSELASLPRVPASRTLMPYSYYRLSSRSGYGAGNKAPAYYGLLWESLCRGEPRYAAHSYLSRVAIWQRQHGTPVSPAEVIEAVRLADALAELRGSSVPALRDLRDAAVTCLGQGRFSAISQAVADTEIGTRIGTLPDGVSRTSIQADFYRQLRDLKLEKYRSVTAQELPLDLRENRMVKQEKSAFLDLERSFFLHRLRVLGIGFARLGKAAQENATWAEPWTLCWTPEAEIELVEAALKGDTIAQAAALQMKERVEDAAGMGGIAAVIEDAFTCGMPAAVRNATAALQAMAVEAVALDDLAATAHRLSAVLQYGSIRRLDAAPLIPILQQIFLRACLLLPGACICDDGGAEAITEAMNRLNAASLAHESLDGEAWLHALWETAGRDDLNTRCSGFAAAILLERGVMDGKTLSTEVQRRLSRGVPADLGAGWFEGLAMKNRYALIARLSLWESLSRYLDTLDEEEFKRALVFLRRTFADFSPREKSDIAENLGEIWQLDALSVSEAVNAPLDGEAEKLLESLDEFDFGDI